MAAPQPFLTDDQKLRLHGFRIFSREAGKEPVWERKHRRHYQTIALAIVARERGEIQRLKK